MIPPLAALADYILGHVFALSFAQPGELGNAGARRETAWYFTEGKTAA
jgi:hypothetical protein